MKACCKLPAADILCAFFSEDVAISRLCPPLDGSAYPGRHTFVSQTYLSLYAVVLYSYNVYLTCVHPGAVTAAARRQGADHPPRLFDSYAPLGCNMRATLKSGATVWGFVPGPSWALVRWTVWLLRPGAIGLALFAALGGEDLGCPDPELSVGKEDAFRANAGTWWSLFLWSAAAALSLQTWEVIGTKDLELIGLRRETSAVKVTLVPLSAAVLAALQVAEMLMIESTSLLAQLLCRCFMGVDSLLASQMFLLLLLLLLQHAAAIYFSHCYSDGDGHDGIAARPRCLRVELLETLEEKLTVVSMYAFVLLLLFVAMAAVALRLLPVRYLSMLPAFYNWIAKVAPKEEYQFLWDSLALDEEDLTDACRKLILVAILMLFSSL
ncbi:hypothetical protein AK812_SmicGene20370, partial [Symbiodinium microadriaticum]